MISTPIQKERMCRLTCDSTVLFWVTSAFILSSMCVTLMKCMLMKVQPFFVLLGYLGDLENKVQSEESGTTVTNSVHWFYSTGKVSRLVCRAWVILSMP